MHLAQFIERIDRPMAGNVSCLQAQLHRPHKSHLADQASCSFHRAFQLATAMDGESTGTRLVSKDSP